MENDPVRTPPQVWNFSHFFLTGSLILVCDLVRNPLLSSEYWAGRRRARPVRAAPCRGRARLLHLPVIVRYLHTS